MTQTCKIPRSPKVAASLLAEIDQLLAVELFRALSDPTRNKLLACLAKCGRPCSVSEVAECCHVDLSVVSRHLSILAAAEILESYKEGRTVFYKVKFDSVTTVLRNLAQAFEDCCAGNAKVLAIKKGIKKENDRRPKNKS